MNLLTKLAVISILLSPLAANAELITADFTGTFRSSSNSLYTEGFQFQFSLTYDDAKNGTSSNGYADGPNGVGEFGEGDDILSSTTRLTPDGETEFFRYDSSGNVVSYIKYSTPYDFLTDNIILRTDIMPTYSGAAEDWYEFSSRGLTGGNGHPNLFSQTNDDFSFGFEWFDDGFFTETLPDGSNVYGWGSANWVFLSESDGLLVEQLAFLITEVKYSTVPEPSSVALFAIGLAGMGLIRRRTRAV